MIDDELTAAWVPDDDPERDWEEAAEIAVEWMLAEATQHAGDPLLVTPTQHQWDATPALHAFTQRFEATTPRGRRALSGNRPVLAYVPDYDTFSLAAGYARKSVLVIVESESHPVSGWAMEVGATNLLTGEVTKDTRTKEQAKEFERIHFYGNNNWTTGFGKDQSTRILQDMHAKGILDRDLLLGYQLAKHHHGKGLDRLAKMVDGIAPRPPRPTWY
jgi:hypothetical protein